MNEEKKALRAGLGYTIGNVFVKGINFLTLPLFSRFLSTEEFGVYSVFLSYDAILSVLIGFALHTSVKSAYYQFKKTDQYVSSISIIYLVNAFICIGIMLIAGDGLMKYIGFDKTILLMLILFSFSGAIVQLYNEKISLDYEYRKYLTVALLNSLGNVVISLVLITTLFRYKRDLGRIIGTTIAVFLISLCLLLKQYREAAPRINKEFWKFGLSYSLPIVPHGISQVLLAQSDRIMISRMVSDSAAGIYSLAGNLKLILTVISTSIGVSWSTWFFSKIDKREVDEIQDSSALLVRLFLIFTIGLMSLSPEIIRILGGDKYLTGRYVAIPMVMDAFVLFLYNIIVPSEYYTKKTKYIMIGTLTSACINLMANYIFISRFGFIAAAYTTLFSYCCYLLMHVIISKRLVDFEVVKWNLIIFSFFAAGFVGVFDLIFLNNIAARYILCFAAVVLLCPPLLKRYLNRRSTINE